MGRRYDAMSRMHFSTLRGRPLRGSSGNELGRIDDCVVRLLEGALPQLTGLLLQLQGGDVFVSMRDVAELGPEGARLSADRVDTRPFERRSGEVLLGRDVVGGAVIEVVEARLIRVGDLVLEGDGAAWRVVAVIPSPAMDPLRTLRRILRRETPLEEIEWTRIEPLVGHVPTAAQRLSVRVARLRPADIADIVEEASHEEGQEILEAVHQDHELEADVFEELDEEHQVEFLRERSDADVAALLADMGPDDAADLLMKLEPERRPRILELVPEAERNRLRRLLSYNPQTAGGLMSTEFVALPESASVQDAIQELRRLPDVPDTLAVIFTLKGDRLSGAVALPRLLRADPSQSLRDLGNHHPVAVFPDADIPSIAVEMADYNLAALPVVDEGGRLLGVVTYDDLVEALVPDEWRWRGDANQEHRYEPSAQR
jgi:CBS domain-containing protein